MIDWHELGFHICAAASNGEEALEMACRFEPDLIICDLKMPVMDGLQLIQASKEKNIDCEFLVISNYEDFDYVRSALVSGAADYILKISISPEVLTAQLQKMKEKLDQKLEEKQTHTSDKNTLLLHQERSAAWRDFFIHKSYPLKILSDVEGNSFQGIGPYAMCFISFDWYSQNLETLPGGDLIRSTLKNVLEQIDRRRIIFFSSSDILLVIPEEELALHHNSIAGLAARTMQLFQYYMSLTPAILYKSQIPDILQARTAYHQMHDLLELDFYQKLELIDADTCKTASYMPGISYKELASDILSHGEDQLEYATRRSDDLLKACGEAHILPTKVIQYFLRLIGELEYHASAVTLQAHDSIADSAEYIRNAVSQEEFLQYLTDVYRALFVPEKKAASSSSVKSPEVASAISYIQNHYNRKISLTSVAEQVGLSSGYLCRIFKEETGQSITSYINHLRMVQAASLLNAGNDYIKEVAMLVGFDDQLYFSRMFKRYYGVTPSEYRNSSR